MRVLVVALFGCAGGAGGEWPDAAPGDDLNPGAGGCTCKSAPGADVIAPITISAGMTLTLGIDMPGADPALYLIEDCTDESTCVAGVDTGGDADEGLAYQNLGPDQTLYLVIDTADGLQPYFLSVDIR